MLQGLQLQDRACGRAGRVRGIAFPVSVLAHAALVAAALTASMAPVVAPESPRRAPILHTWPLAEVRASDTGGSPAPAPVLPRPTHTRRGQSREGRRALAPPALPSLQSPLDVTALAASSDAFFDGTPGLLPGRAGLDSVTGDGGGGAPGAGGAGDGGPAFRVGGDVQPPAKLRHVTPDYPELARRARQEGRVVLECTIDVHGRVVDARVVRGTPLLDQAALDAVREWRYAPTLLNGVPVAIVMTVTVMFTLR